MKVWLYSWEPSGTPKTLRPVVISTGTLWLFSSNLVENFRIALSRDWPVSKDAA